MACRPVIHPSRPPCRRPAQLQLVFGTPNPFALPDDLVYTPCQGGSDLCHLLRCLRPKRLRRTFESVLRSGLTRAVRLRKKRGRRLSGSNKLSRAISEANSKQILGGRLRGANIFITPSRNCWKSPPGQSHKIPSCKSGSTFLTASPKRSRISYSRSGRYWPARQRRRRKDDEHECQP